MWRIGSYGEILAKYKESGVMFKTGSKDKEVEGSVRQRDVDPD